MWFIKLFRLPACVRHLYRSSDGEVKRGDNVNAIMDLLPEGTVLAMTLVVQPQDRLEESFASLSRNSMGENVDSLRAREDAATARSFLGNKHKLYRAAITLLIRAQDLETLDKRYLDLSSKLLNCGLEPVNPEHDIGPLSTYIRALPMCFNPHMDKHNWYTRLMFVQHFACLAPFMVGTRGRVTRGLRSGIVVVAPFPLIRSIKMTVPRTRICCFLGRQEPVSLLLRSTNWRR